jgi:hypothetical protein
MAHTWPGAGKGCLSCRGSRRLAIGNWKGVRPPRPSSAIFLPLLNSTSLLLQGTITDYHKFSTSALSIHATTQMTNSLLSTLHNV